MRETTDKVAALANISAYDAEGAKDYINGAPHIKHACLRELYARLLLQVFSHAKQYSGMPRVLDLGAGEGSVTLPLLEMGAQVTAVDISKDQLEILRTKCKEFEMRLEIRCENIGESLKMRDRLYDIIVAHSFLHHIPDYLGMINNLIPLVTEHGQFFSFQDPLRYNSLPRWVKLFSDVSYGSWRLTRGDVWEGLKRHIRRKCGVYLDNSIHDNTEYHVMREGVDQDAIANLFREHKFKCEVVRYFSTQSGAFQAMGDAIGVTNTFAIIAQKICKE